MIIGKNLTDGSDFEQDLSVFMRTHTFIQSMTGGGKTSIILTQVKETRNERPETQMIFIENQEEFTDIPKFYSDFRLISRKSTPKIFTLDHAKDIGIQARRLGLSMVLNLFDFKEKADQKKFVEKFLEGFMSLGKQVGTPVKIFIDEADQFCPRLDKKDARGSKEQIIDVAKRGRKFNITLVIATQYLSEVDISVRRECANRIVGKTTELSDRRVVKELMGLSQVQADELFDFTAGNFYVRGEMFKKGVSRILVKESDITRKQAGVSEESTKSTDNIDTIFEDAVENKNSQTLVEILQAEVIELRKQLAEQKIKTKQAWSEGFLTCDKQWKDKSRLDKVFS